MTAADRGRPAGAGDGAAARYRLGTAEVAGAATAVIDLAGRVHPLADVLARAGAADGPVSLDRVFGDWDAWRPVLDRAVAAWDGRGADALVEEDLAWLPPLARPPKVICVGVNYRDHLEEMGVPKPPEYPYAFLRPATSLNGHRREIPLPSWPRMIDWEAELGVVVGRRGRELRGADALAAVAAYTVVNDLSARDWIESRPFVGIDWVMQKAWDGFQPTGPWLTPAAFVPDPQALAIELTVNGEPKQVSNTGNMVFGVQAIVEHLSAIMTLEPGDVIATGTPAGVGFGRSPREFLRPGDVVAVTVEGLGRLENRVV